MRNVEAIWEQVCREWYDFDKHAGEEIKYLEQPMLDSGSVSSKGSKKSKLAKSFKSRTSVNTVLSTRADKCKQQQEEAALKVKLAYVEHEKALEMEKIINEQKLEELKLKREIQLNKAKLNVCEKIELEEQLFLAELSLVEELAHIPSESKGQQVRQYLQSLPVTTSTSMGNIEVYSQASQAPVLTTTSTPRSTTCVFRASAPSFPTGAVTQTVNAGHYLEHELSYPTQRELPHSETISPARNYSVTTRPFTGPSPIMSAVIAPVYQSVHPRGQGHSIGERWERVASSLERCMDKLTEANLEQSTVRKQLFVSGHLPKLSISVFNGDPLQYPVWKSAFNALVDSRPLKSDIKLNLLNQHVAGKPKQVVEHYLLIEIEDAYQKARSLLQERYGNCNLVSTAFINQLEKWPTIIPRDTSDLREFSDRLDKVLAARETISGLSILEYPKENMKLLARLPYYLDVKWRNVIKQWRHANGEASYPSFLKFAEFVREAAERANIPELEGMITPTTPKLLRNQKPNYEKNTASSLSISGKSGVIHDPNPKEPNKQKHSRLTDSSKCLFCSQRHRLDDCQDFCKKPFSERRGLFFSERLCICCPISKSHQLKDCKCKTCSGMHSTSLHKEQSQVDVVVSNCVSLCMLPDQGGGFDHTLIVPVWVSQRKKSCSMQSLTTIQMSVLCQRVFANSSIWKVHQPNSC